MPQGEPQPLHRFPSLEQHKHELLHETENTQQPSNNDTIRSEELPDVIKRLAELVRLIRRAFQVITAKSYKSIEEKEKNEQLLIEHKDEFREIRERLEGISITVTTQQMRQYFAALNAVVERLADSERVARSQGHTVDALRKLSMIFFQAMSSPLLMTGEGEEERELLMVPKTSQLVLETQEEVSIPTLYEQGLQDLPLEDLINVHQTLGYFLWVQNTRKLIEDREVRSQLYILIDALQDALEVMIQKKTTYNPRSTVPQERFRILLLGQEISEEARDAVVKEHGLEPKIGNSVITELVREPEDVPPGQQGILDQTTDERYEKAWEKRSMRSLQNAQLIPLANSEAEKDGDRLRSAVFPVGLSDTDLWNDAFWVAGMLDTIPEEGKDSLVEAFKHSSLKDLVKIASDHVGYFSHFDPLVKLLTIPEDVSNIEHQALWAVVNRNIIGCKNMMPPEYYTSGGKVSAEGERIGVDGLDMVYLYTELCRGFERSQTLEELIAYLFPGLSTEDFMPIEKTPLMESYPNAVIEPDRLERLAEATSRYFKAVGMTRASKLVSVFFSNLGGFSRKDWETTKIFHALKREFAKENRGQEEAIRGLALKRYQPLQDLSEETCANYQQAKMLGQLMRGWRFKEAAIRTTVHGHLWRVDTRLRYLAGYVIPDIADQLPDGELIKVRRAIRAIFPEGGYTGQSAVINAAVLELPEHMTVGAS